jgi:hypothetical protein
LVAIVTLDVVIVKFADVLPELTVTEAGTTAAALSLESDTTVPAAGAAEVRVTVPVEVAPDNTLTGFRETPKSPNEGVTTRTPVAVPLLYVAVIVALTEAATELVVAVKVAVEAPAFT